MNGRETHGTEAQVFSDTLSPGRDGNSGSVKGDQTPCQWTDIPSLAPRGSYPPPRRGIWTPCLRECTVRVKLSLCLLLLRGLLASVVSCIGGCLLCNIHLSGYHPFPDIYCSRKAVHIHLSMMTKKLTTLHSLSSLSHPVFVTS